MPPRPISRKNRQNSAYMLRKAGLSYSSLKHLKDSAVLYRKLIAERTEDQYERIRNLYKSWVKHMMRGEDHREDDEGMDEEGEPQDMTNFLPTLPGAPTSIHKLFELGTPAPTYHILQPFFAYYAATVPGILSKHCSVRTLLNRVTVFKNAYFRSTGSSITRIDMTSTEAFIKGKLTETLKLEDNRRHKPIPNAAILTEIVGVIFDPRFQPTHRRLRVQIALLNAILVSTGARINTLLTRKTKRHAETALKYGEAVLHVQRDPAGGPNRWSLLISIMDSRRRKTEESAHRRLVCLEQDSAVFNAPLLYFRLAMEDDALPDWVTYERLRDPSWLGTDVPVAIKIKPEAEDMMIFRRAFSSSDPTVSTDLPMQSQYFNDSLEKLGDILGYRDKLTAHCYRRLVVCSAMSAGVPLEELQYAIHHQIGSDTFKHYLSSNNRIDFAALVLKQKTRGDQIAALDTVGFRRHDAAPMELSAEGHAKVQQEEEVAMAIDECRMYGLDLIQRYKSVALAPAEAKEKYQQLWNSGANVYNRYVRHHWKNEKAEFHRSYPTFVETSEEAPKDPIGIIPVDLGEKVGFDLSRVTAIIGQGNLTSAVNMARWAQDQAEEIMPLLTDEETVRVAEKIGIQVEGGMASGQGAEAEADADADADSESDSEEGDDTGAGSVPGGMMASNSKPKPPQRDEDDLKLDKLCQMINGKNTDALDVFKALDDYPEHRLATRGWLPGLAPKEGDICPVCDVPLDKIIAKPAASQPVGAQGRVTRERQYSHIFDCARLKATADFRKTNTTAAKKVPLAKYSTFDHAFHADPQEWVRTCKAIRKNFLSSIPEGGYNPRSDMLHPADFPSTPNKVECTKYQAIPMVHRMAPDQQGFCLFCVHDPGLPVATQMAPYNDPSVLLGHVKNHIISQGKQDYLDPIVIDKAPDNASSSTAAKGKRLRPGPATYRCPDPGCTSHEGLQLYEIANHLYVYHRLRLKAFPPRGERTNTGTERSSIDGLFQSDNELWIAFGIKEGKVKLRQGSKKGRQSKGRVGPRKYVEEEEDEEEDEDGDGSAPDG